MKRKDRAVGALLMGGLAGFILGPLGGLLVAGASYFMMGSEEKREKRSYGKDRYSSTSYYSYHSDVRPSQTRVREIFDRYSEEPSWLRLQKINEEIGKLTLPKSSDLYRYGPSRVRPYYDIPTARKRGTSSAPTIDEAIRKIIQG